MKFYVKFIANGYDYEVDFDSFDRAVSYCKELEFQGHLFELHAVCKEG